MLSDIISINSNGAINPEQQQERPQSQLLVHLNGVQYRVLSRQYIGKSSMTAFWCVFWLASTLTIASLLFTICQNLSANYVFFCLIFSAIILAAFGLYHRKELWRVLACSIVNLTISFTITSFFLIFSFNYITVPIGLSALVQAVLSIAYIKKRGKIVLSFIILGEAVLLAVKSDGFLHITWSQSLIALIPFFIFLAAAFFFILIYTLLLNLYYDQTFKAKKMSLIFLILNIGCFALLLSLPLAWSFLNLNLTALCIVTMGLTSTNSIYLWIYHQEITLNFCQHKYEVFDSDKQLKVELIPIKIPKKSLYRLSENWFGTQIKDSSLKSPHSKYPECLVCTERRSDIVWLPCGHLSLCTPCCKDVIDNKMISCILCKQKPTHICRIKERNEAENKLDIQMGLAHELKCQSESVVEQYQVRIS